MSLSITGSSWVLGDDHGGSEVVLDLDFTQMTNQDFSAGVNTLSDGTTCWFYKDGAPDPAGIRNGKGFATRCLAAGGVDTARLYFNVTGAINAGKSASDPGRYNPRDRFRIICEISCSTLLGAGDPGDGVYLYIANGLQNQVGSGVFGGTPPGTAASISHLHLDSGNSNKLTPRVWAEIGLNNYTSADYTAAPARALTADHTYFILETDNLEGSGWTRYKTGSAPIAPYTTGLPTPDDLTTVGRTRLVASDALAIGSDNSPFTGSVIAGVVFWAPVNEISASLRRLAVVRYGNVR